MTSIPCLVDGCPETFDSAPLLAAHLVDAHLWNGSTAYERARAAFQQPVSEVGQMMKKEPIRRDAEDALRAGRPQKGQPSPPLARPGCGYCHRPDGTHSKGCKKTACKLCAKRAPKKCPFHSGQGDRPGPKALRLRTYTSGKVTVAVGGRYLDKLKAAIAEHERKATALREALALLEG